MLVLSRWDCFAVVLAILVRQPFRQLFETSCWSFTVIVFSRLSNFSYFHFSWENDHRCKINVLFRCTTHNVPLCHFQTLHTNRGQTSPTTTAQFLIVVLPSTSRPLVGLIQQDRWRQLSPSCPPIGWDQVKYCCGSCPSYPVLSTRALGHGAHFTIWQASLNQLWITVYFSETMKCFSTGESCFFPFSFFFFYSIQTIVTNCVLFCTVKNSLSHQTGHVYEIYIYKYIFYTFL